VSVVSNFRPTLGGLVTVMGSNFGASASVTSVIIGSSVCSSPTTLAAHSAVICTLAPLSALPSHGLSVRVTVSNQTGSTASFSYDLPSVFSIIGAFRPTSGGIRVTCSSFPVNCILFYRLTLPFPPQFPA
jgi:hypothetical protein